MVLAVHSAQIVFHPGLYATILSKGAYGVQLFFIVSSLALFLSYEQRKLLDGKNINNFFFIRRFFRIAPAFYLAICLYTLAFFIKSDILLGYYGTIDWTQVLIFASFLGVFFPSSMFLLPFGGWTVEIEMFFYIFIPFLFKQISGIKKALIFFALSWLSYFILEHFLFKMFQGDYSSYLLFPAQIPVFAIGIVLFHIINKQAFKITRPYLFFLSLVTCLWLMLALSEKFVFLYEHILFSLFFSGIILLMSSNNINLLQNKITTFLGKVSYSLYLCHFIIILFFWYVYRASSHFWNLNPVISFLFIYFSTLSIGAIVSWLSYTYIEKTGMNFGKKMIQKINY